MRTLRLSPYLGAAGALALLLGQPLAFTVALLCILMHECAHALAARVIGFTVQEIRLSPIGASLTLAPDPQKSALCEIVIASAGPVANAWFAMAFALLYRRFGTETLRLLVSYNVAFCLFNLLPALPMDGGRILRAMLALWMPRMRATRIAADLGLCCAVGLFVLGFAGARVYGVNATLFLCGAAVGFSAWNMRRNSIGQQVLATCGKSDAMARGGGLAVREIAVGRSANLGDVACLLRGDAFYRILVYDENMRKICVSDEVCLTHAIARYGAQAGVECLCVPAYDN